MSQTKVTSYYNTRKNIRSPRKKVVNSELSKTVTISSEGKSVIESNYQTTKRRTARGASKIKGEPKPPQNISIVEENNIKSAVKTETSKVAEVKQKTGKRGNRTRKSTKKSSKVAVDPSALASQSKVTSFYCASNNSDDTVKSSIKLDADDISTVAAPQNPGENESKCERQESAHEPLLLSPKRNLTNPNEGTPPKKRLFELKNIVQQTGSSFKYSDEVSRKLILDEDEQELVEPSTNISVALETELKENGKKVIPRNISQETQKALTDFKEKLARVRNYESNPCKVTSIISSCKEIGKTSAVPSVPAYQRYSYLVNPETSSSLILPFKYKLLLEIFRSMDTVVSILNNRKEKITFEKVKEGIQKMMKRNFTNIHLGQIVKIMPSAYNVTIEKCTFKKANDPDYELIISPALAEHEGSNKKTKSTGNVTMTPQMLLERKQEFNQRLLDLVKIHHNKFLIRLNFPPVPEESVKRWHPKFPVDSVPDIEVAELPKIPEVKVCTAKDVLSRMVKGPVSGKVVNALKSVVEETSTPKIETEQNSRNTNAPTTKSALKGVCADLLAKVRERESAKLLKCMTESPDEVKKKAMLERLPKIIQILWHYFIAERKAAVPVDTAIEKIIHSFNSLSTYEEVKAHLALITETFPGWLSFIQIPKGLFITMDKNRNISEMMNKLQC